MCHIGCLSGVANQIKSSRVKLCVFTSSVCMSFLDFSAQSLVKDARDRDRHVGFVRLLLQKLKSLQQRVGYTL